MTVIVKMCVDVCVPITIHLQLYVWVLLYIRVVSEPVEVIVHVERVSFSQMDEFLQSLINKDDADEGSKSFLCESCDVTHQWAGVCGDQQQAEKSRPQTDTHT